MADPEEIYQAFLSLGNPRRITACLEFLEGIPTGLIERFVADGKEHRGGGPLAEVRSHIMTWARCNHHIFGAEDDWNK